MLSHFGEEVDPLFCWTRVQSEFRKFRCSNLIPGDKNVDLVDLRNIKEGGASHYVMWIDHLALGNNADNPPGNATYQEAGLGDVCEKKQQQK